MFELNNEDIEWNCEICEDPLDRYSYVTNVTINTGEVVKAEDGRVIDMEPQFPPEIENLCFTCFQAKYKDPVKALRTVLGVLVSTVELLEEVAESRLDHTTEEREAGLEKLKQLVVYITEVLPSLPQEEAIDG